MMRAESRSSNGVLQCAEINLKETAAKRAVKAFMMVKKLRL